MLVFLFVFTRVAGLVLAAPVYGTRFAPRWTRLMLAVAVALLVAPVFCQAQLPGWDNAGAILVALSREAILGLVMGLTILILAAGVQAGGEVVAQMTGMSLAVSGSADDGSQAPVFGKVLDLVTLAVFLLVGGHRQVLAALLDTFQWMPPGRVAFASGPVESLSDVVAESIVLGVRTAAPIMIALLLTTLILGLINRVVPRWNVLAVGFSANAAIAVGVLALSAGSAAWFFQEQAQARLETIEAGFQPLPEAEQPAHHSEPVSWDSHPNQPARAEVRLCRGEQDRR
jgi:flagellar biosynthetic protein FliR